MEDCGAVRRPDADLVSDKRNGLEDEVKSVSGVVVHATTGADDADSELEGPQLATGRVFDPVDTAIGAAGFPVENEFAEADEVEVREDGLGVVGAIVWPWDSAGNRNFEQVPRYTSGCRAYAPRRTFWAHRAPRWAC